jgi:putative ABC transport system permease protein
MDDTLADSIAMERLVTSVFALSAGVAVLLSVLGVYGLLSYVASLRLGEIAVRIAVGATPLHIRGLLVSSNLRMILAGAALGTVGAVLMGRFLGSLVFGVDPLDSIWYLGSALALISTAIAAAFDTAVRASRRNPVELLSRGSGWG